MKNDGKFEITDSKGDKWEIESMHKKMYGDVPYSKIKMKPLILLPVAVPYGNESDEEAQKRVEDTTFLID